MGTVNIIGPITLYVDWALAIVFAGAALFAAFDALSRRPDAFAAVDKQTKATWSGITVSCAAVMVLGLLFGDPFLPIDLLWLAAVVGVLVYLLDVRPRLREVQRGSRW